MGDVARSLWTVAGWIEDHGYRLAGYHREIYLHYHPAEADQGVTELQFPVATTRSASARKGPSGASR